MALLSLNGQAFLQNTHPPPHPLAARGLEMEPGMGMSEDTHIPSREQEMGNWKVHEYECCLFWGTEEYSTVTIKY